jgi:hypothetical protein
MNTENPKIVHNLTALSAFGLAVCSGGMSISFGLTLADSMPLKFVFGLMLLSLAVAEFVAAYFLAKAWNSRQVIKIILAIYLMLGGLAVSVLCGQATLQQSLDTAQQTRRLQSDVYQAAVAQRKKAAEKAAALSIDETQALAAQNALTALSHEKQAYLAKPATNSRGQSAGTIGVRVGDCTGTSFYVKKYCGKIRTLDSQIRDAKATVDKWNAYKNAKAHLDDLESKPLPNAVKEAELPGISAIALILETDGEHVGAILFFCLAVFVETAALILVVFLGSDSAAKSASGVSTTPPYIVAQPQQQVAQAGRVSTTPPHIVPQPQQQSQVETLSESLPQNAVPKVYQQVVDDIQAKKLRNCSFRTLMNRYGVNQNQATVIRLKLVEEGKAKFNRRHELDLL